MIKESMMRWKWHVEHMCGIDICTQFLLESVKGRDHSESLSTHERIGLILEWILKTGCELVNWISDISVCCGCEFEDD
jgi:hypothetical protein